MNQLQRPNAAWMTARIFLPSPASLALCVIVAVAAVCLHVLAIGVAQGALFDNFLGGQWTDVYASTYRGPINGFLAHTTLNNGLEVVLWGAVGMVVYTLAERFFASYASWREAERDIQMIAPGNVVRRPLKKPFYLIVSYRLAIGVLLAIWAVIALVMARHLFLVDGLPFSNTATEHFNLYLLSLTIQWLVLGHALVVLLRLTAQRARLFQKPREDDFGFFQD